MTSPLSVFAVLFLSLYFISGTVALYVTILGWRHRNIPVSRPFTLLMACLTIYIYAYIFEVLSPDLETSLVFNNIEIPCMLTIPVAFLMIVLYSTGRERYVTLRTLPLFFLGVIVLSSLEFTNPLHYLYYTGFSSSTYEGLVFWIHGHGPFFWLTIAYTYALVFAALVLIVSHLSMTGPCHRRSLTLLLAAAIVPIVINLLCTFWVTPYTGIDLTQLSFLISGLILAFGLFRYLFSTAPVAYTRVLSTMQDGVIITDGSSRVIDLNPAAMQITGVRLRDAAGREIGTLMPELVSCLAGTCLTEEGTRTECLIPQAGGKPRYYDVIAMPLGEQGSGSEGGLFVLRDITERKQSELALTEANKKISLLSTITRHDIRNQLMALKAYIQLSEESVHHPADVSEYLRQGQKIVETIDRQIVFTRNYENLGVNPPAWQDVCACISRGMEGLFTKKIRIDVEPDRLEVFADPLLEKVFYNLIDNALRYGGDRLTTIRVRSHEEDAAVVLIFEDDGDGVTPDDKPLLFAKGFGKNTGLGLFLSREILSITGITIMETSEPGRGARFEIRVPAGKFRYTEEQ
ncbi:histidine kinase N-terminal 7TM domain-containing protein [uncultured Methanoregula sp.]|uniref:histidine kinase N-terminal 7TM domain-containing protein n=1 Tax=uncultured Methanoregula sp. TaxID=1005933 RepID=UPI002AAAAC6D|nr:histidine kinase N-terminal 7TM domain-containing protein [uncultured Methanoregula sp.]